MVKIYQAPVAMEHDAFVGEGYAPSDLTVSDIRSVSDLYNEDYRQSDLNLTAVRDVCCCCSCCPCCSCCAVASVDPFEHKIW